MIKNRSLIIGGLRWPELLRRVLLSWLLAATVEFLLLPGQWRDLSELEGLAQMSLLRVLLLTAGMTVVLSLFSRSSKTRWVQIGGIGVVLAVAFSRMYLGVHTPKDVLVSLAVGAAWIFLLYPLIYKGFEKPKVMYGVISGVFLLSLANLLFVFLYQFPANVDATNLADAKKTSSQLFAIVLAMCVLYPVDHHWIKFRTDAVWWAQILKLIGGVAIILAVRLLLKAPLNALFGINLGCGVRYFLMVIAAGILWPMTFGWFAGLGKKEA